MEEKLTPEKIDALPSESPIKEKTSAKEQNSPREKWADIKKPKSWWKEKIRTIFVLSEDHDIFDDIKDGDNGARIVEIFNDWQYKDRIDNFFEKLNEEEEQKESSKKLRPEQKKFKTLDASETEHDFEAGQTIWRVTRNGGKLDYKITEIDKTNRKYKDDFWRGFREFTDCYAEEKDADNKIKEIEARFVENYPDAEFKDGNHEARVGDMVYYVLLDRKNPDGSKLLDYDITAINPDTKSFEYGNKSWDKFISHYKSKEEANTELEKKKAELKQEEASSAEEEASESSAEPEPTEVKTEPITEVTTGETNDEENSESESKKFPELTDLGDIDDLLSDTTNEGEKGDETVGKGEKSEEDSANSPESDNVEKNAEHKEEENNLVNKFTNRCAENNEEHEFRIGQTVYWVSPSGFYFKDKIKEIDSNTGKYRPENDNRWFSLSEVCLTKKRADEKKTQRQGQKKEQKSEASTQEETDALLEAAPNIVEGSEETKEAPGATTETKETKEKKDGDESSAETQESSKKTKGTPDNAPGTRFLLNLAKVKEVYKDSEISEEEMERRAKIMESASMPEEIKDLLRQLQGGIFKKNEEINEIKKRLVKETGLNINIINQIFANQEDVIRRAAGRNVAAKKGLLKKVGTAIGKLGLYTAIGAGLTVGTVGTGGWAALGAVSFGSLKVLDRLRSGEKQEHAINEELAKIKDKEDVCKSFENNIIAELAVRMQEFIDNNQGEKDKIKQYKDNVSNYLSQNENTKNLNNDQKEEIVRACGYLAEIDQANAGLEEKFARKKSVLLDNIANNVARGINAILRTRETAGQQAGTTAVIVGAGWLAREVPIVKNILFAYAGARIGDLFARSFEGTRRMSAGELEKDYDNPKDFLIAQARMRAQLVDESFKEQNPEEYYKFKEAAGRFEDKNAEKIIEALEVRNNAIENKIKETRSGQRKKMAARFALRTSLAVAGAIFPNVAKEALAFADKKLYTGKEYFGELFSSDSTPVEEPGVPEGLPDVPDDPETTQVSDISVDHTKNTSDGNVIKDQGTQGSIEQVSEEASGQSQIVAGEQTLVNIARGAEIPVVEATPKYPTTEIKREWVRGDNEKLLHFGGDRRTGLDSDGNFVYDISKMKDIGDMKNVRMLITLSGDNQGEVIELPVNADGTIVIDDDSKFAKKLFAKSDDGQLVFKGKQLEIAQVSEQTGGGPQEVKILATVKGENNLSQENIEEITSSKVQSTSSEAKNTRVFQISDIEKRGGTEVAGLENEVRMPDGHELKFNEHLIKTGDQYSLVGTDEKGGQFEIFRFKSELSQADVIKAVETHNTELAEAVKGTNIDPISYMREADLPFDPGQNAENIEKLSVLVQNNIPTGQAQEVINLANSAGVELEIAAKNFNLLDKEYYDSGTREAILKIFNGEDVKKTLTSLDKNLTGIKAVEIVREDGVKFSYESGEWLTIKDDRAILTLLAPDLSQPQPVGILEMNGSQIKNMLANPKEAFGISESTPTPTQTSTEVPSPTPTATPIATETVEQGRGASLEEFAGQVRNSAENAYSVEQVQEAVNNLFGNNYQYSAETDGLTRLFLDNKDTDAKEFLFGRDLMDKFTAEKVDSRNILNLDYKNGQSHIYVGEGKMGKSLDDLKNFNLDGLKKMIEDVGKK